MFDVTTGDRAYDVDVGADIKGRSLTSDGRHLALPTGNGLHIITTDLHELIELALGRIGRDLTDNECRTYLHISACSDG